MSSRIARQWERIPSCPFSANPARITPKTFAYFRAIIVLAVLGIAGGASAQTAVTLLWNQNSGSVAGYYIYQGTNSHGYKTRIDAGKLLQKQLTGLTAGATYYFALSSYNSAGVESDFSAEVSYTAANSLLPPPIISLTPGVTLAANSGTITLPFVITSGMLSQPIQTTLGLSGRAAYTFTNLFPGEYVVSAQVIAPSASANAFYVNMDAEPTDPMMIWNLAVSTVATNETVTWQGVSDSVSKVFYLSAGVHQLIVRGMDANTQLGTIAITPAPFRLQALPNKQITLSGVGQINYGYDVLATTNLKTWTVIGSFTTDVAGSFSFTDAAAASIPVRH